MTTPDESTKDTQPAIEAAPPVELPSWHGPVEEVMGRVTKLEAASVVTNAKLESIEKKTDAQTLILSRLDKVTADPKVRALFWALVFAFVAWLAKHGIEVRIPQ